MSSSLSVIVPTWQRAETLTQLLQAILCEEEAEFEVIVVCDGEDAATRELSETFSDPRVRWIFHQNNLGLPAARNTGAVSANKEILLFLDDDLEITPGLLQSHAEAHGAQANLAVQGLIIERALAPQKTKTGSFLEQGWMRTLETFANDSWSNDQVAIPSNAVPMSWFGTNCSIRREFFHELGGFDPKLRTSDEEMEFGCRLYMRGARFQIESRAIVFHRNSKDLLSYFGGCWKASGQMDVLRAMHMNQRNAQTRRLIAMENGPYLSRMWQRAIWNNGVLARKTASALYRATEATGSRMSFRLWHEASRAQQYWDGVRDAGMTREELRTLAPSPSRVLMLHSIAIPTNTSESTYYLSPLRFRRLLDVLRASEYRSVEPEALQQPECGGKDFLLTFDDGYDDFYTEVFPLCDQYRLKPLVFLPAAHIGQSNIWDQSRGLRARNLLRLEQVREMQKYGVRFGSHTSTHPSLPSMSDTQLRSELCDSKKMLEDLLGTEVSTFAYPCGEANRRVRAAVIEAGYKLAFSTKAGLNVWEDPFDMRRIEFNETDTVALYGFKLWAGMTLREAAKFQLNPLLHTIPGSLRRKLRQLREKLRPGHQQEDSVQLLLRHRSKQ